MAGSGDRGDQTPKGRERLENFEGLVRAQHEWADVLRAFAEAPTEEEGQRRLVAELGFTEYQAMAICISMYFRDLVGEKRQLFVERLEEERRYSEASREK